MEGSDLIAVVLNYTDNTDALDADNAIRRLRILQYIQEVVDFVWAYRLWGFSYTSSSVTVLSNTSSIDLPANFHQFTKNGQVNLSDGTFLLEIPEHQMLEIRATQNSGVSTRVEEFSLFGFNTTSGRRLIQTVTVGAATVLNIYYKRVPPTITDATSSSGLAQVPVEYHNTVLLPGVIAKTRKSKGDSRDFKSDFMEGLAYMGAAERPLQRAVQRVPMALTDKW